MDKFFEIALIVPYVSQKINLLEKFLQDLRRDYSPSVLKSINLYSWSASDSIGIILAFEFSAFLPSYFKKIKAWTEKSGARLYELMAFGENERKDVKSKYIMTADLKFIGDFDISFALTSILGRINATRGRKQPRYSTSIKVAFQSKEQFVQEYTKDISKGGIFVATDKPLSLGTKIELILSLPNSSKEVKVIGEIVHIIGREQAILMGYGMVSGMGVQFLEFEEDGQKYLEEYFKVLSKEGLNLSRGADNG